MNAPLISIIIPTYNVAPYIYKCLDSVGKQSYFGPIECLIIDDCGSDNSIAIAKDFISKYVGKVTFSIVQHKQNSGLSAARNTGVKAAQGDYLYFLDSDDWISSNCIDELVNQVITHPLVDIVIGSSYIAYPDRLVKYSGLMPNPDLTPAFTESKEEIISLLLGYDKLPVIACNKLYKKAFLDRHRIAFKEGLLNEDVLYNFYIAKSASSMCICYTPTYYYFRREDGINMTIAGKNAKYFLNIASDILDNMDSCTQKIALKVCLKIAHKFYVYSEEKCYQTQAKSLLKHISTMVSLKEKLAIQCLLMLPKAVNRNKRVFNWFMCHIFETGSMYQI